MLYQTLSFSFQLNPSSSSSISSSSFSSTSLPCTLVNEKENHMAFVEQKALKTSFWPETGLKSSQQVFPEDFWCGNGGNGGVGVTGDDLFVDGLLDFSNEDVCVEDDDEKVFCFSHEKGSEEDEEQKGSMKEEFGSVGSVGSVLPPSEPTVPVEELANLEWLSNFVEESDFSEYSLQHFQPVKPQIPNQNRSEPETPVYKTGFLSSVPAKARSKRSRTGGRVWSLGSLPNTDSSSSSYSSSHSSSPSSSSSSSCLISNRTGYELFSYLGKPPKKPKRKPVSFSEAYHHDHMLFHHFNQYHHRQQQQQQQQQRRCTHCGVQKTPQWRTGPMGAKTLCNACGVRYKSGRLLPEYRPACSPTFSSEVHSNNHRKVLEMRRKKEMQVRPSYLSGSA